MQSNRHPFQRLEFLDALRGIAALWVVLFHMIYIPVPNLAAPRWAAPWVTVGGMGVTLFFVVSAFSLCYTMPYHHRERRPLLSFYVRRFFRIAPLFYFILAASIVYGAHHFAFIPDLGAILASILFVFNFIPDMQVGIVWASWTIGVEMPFYLLFPLFYRWFDNAWKAGAFLAFTILCAGLAKFLVGLAAPGSDEFMKWSIARHLPVFACGMLSFHICTIILRNGSPGRERGIFIVGLALLLFTALLQGSTPGLLDSYYWQAIMFSALLVGLAIHPTAVLVNRLTAFLGKLSYSLYLIHPILIHSLSPVYHKIYAWQAPLTVRWGASVALTLALLVLLAYLTYRLVEKPGMRLGAKAVARINGARRPPATHHAG